MANNQAGTAAVVVPGTGIAPNKLPLQVTLINADGTAAGTVKKQAAQADTTAVDLAALKVDFNLLLAKLRLAGVIS